MKKTSYAFNVGYIRSLENRLLSDAKLEQLKQSSDIVEFIDRLISIGYEIKRVTNLEDFSLQLDDYFNSICNFIQKSCPKNTPFNWLWLKNDAFNYKAVLKSIFSNLNWEELILTPYTIEPETMAESIKTQNFENMPDYFKELAKTSFDILSKTNDSNKTEVYLDKTMFKIMLDLSKDDEFLFERTCLNITLENLAIAIRYIIMNKNLDNLKDVLIDRGQIDIDKISNAALGGIEGIAPLLEEYGFKKSADDLIENPALIEEFKLNRLKEFDKKSASVAFGFSPIVSYIKNLQREHKRLKETAMIIEWNKCAKNNG